MFYTRPKIEPLNLDLVRLNGGGSRPSQFYGTTVDGQSLYIRYRYGWLTAHSGELGCEPGSESKELLEMRIGPMFHGDILMEQVCDLLGLTLFGIKPPFTEEDRIKAADQSLVLDWSGRTTYWVESLQVTKEGGRRFAEGLKAAFADVTILESGWQHSGRAYVQRQSIEECEMQATIGINAEPVRLKSILNSEQVGPWNVNDVFKYVIGFSFDWNRRPDSEFYANWTQYTSEFFQVFGNQAVLADRNSGMLSGEFATTDPNSKQFVDHLYQVIETCFARQIAWVDPQGTVLRVADRQALHSRDLVDWSRRSPNRYLSWGNEDFGNGKIIAAVKAL